MDPALLDVLAQINRPMPAIVEPAPGMDGGPVAHAYDMLMRERNRDFDRWFEADTKARAALFERIQASPEGFSPEMITAIIEPFEKRIRREFRTTRRLKRSAERYPLRDPLQRRVQTWLFESQLRHAAATEELLLFLRAVRAEVSSASRTGPIFDNAEDLERYLLADVA